MKLILFGFEIDSLTVFGLGAQFLFFLRFIYQWLVSEKKKESIIPIEFWYFSIIGGILIIIYAFLRRDLVFFLGQIFALYIYLRNLILVKRKDNLSDNFKKYQTKNPIKKYFLNQFLKTINDLVKTLKAKKILDVGCGEGQVISRLLKENPYLKVIGVDRSTEAIKLAKKDVRRVKFLVADIFKVSKVLSKERFDLVLCLEVLEHLKNPNLALKELKKIKANYFLFSVPKEPWFSVGNLLIGKNIKRLGKDKGHKWFWTRQKFVNLLIKDFKIVKLISNPFWTIVLSKTV